MKCLLYIPPFECEGTRYSNIAEVRVGGLNLYQRACRSLQKAGFDEIFLARPGTMEIRPDPLVTIPIHLFEYTIRIYELADPIMNAMALEDTDSCCLFVLDGMVSPECFGMRPRGADVRIRANAEDTGIYFVTASKFKAIMTSGDVLAALESEINETFDAPEKTVYHRMLSVDDVKIAQNILTKSLRKPLGRDADGLIAYAINRPCSLQISKRIANSFITPNMVTVFGLILGLGAAALVFFGKPILMVIGVILWQISSMVDGIDGELARMRISPSHKGEWFDTVADDITNITFMFGLGHAIFVLTQNPIYFYISSGVCVLMVIAVLWFYREFVKMGIASHNHFEWGFESENKANQNDEHRSFFKKIVELIAGGFAWIAKRDFYTFLIMCLVLVTLYKPAYYVMLTGASFVGVGSICALSLRAIKKSKKQKNLDKSETVPHSFNSSESENKTSDLNDNQDDSVSKTQTEV